MTTGVYKSVAALVAAALLGACSSGGSGAADDDARVDEAEPAAAEEDAEGDTATDAATDADEAAHPEPELFEEGDFYEVPDPLPEGTHGDLIRYEPLDDAPIEGATRYRIMYLSESVPGDPIAVTGTALVPDAEAPPGGRDTLTLAHGTSGIADECAPSKYAEQGGAADALAGATIDDGYLLADTDYEGLGTPGRHPYLVGESEGRGVLDAARAVRQLPDAEPGDRMAIAGYSQGGHGALWAGQLAAEWTPELELVGTFAGAPATELGIIINAVGALPTAGFLYMIVAGFEAAYPGEADPSLLLTPAGVDALAAVDEGCTGQIMSAVAETPSDELVKPDPGSVEPWATLADDNDPGRVTSDSPILVLHSAQDDLVPPVLSQIMFDRMCDLGQQVERRVYEDAGGHGEAAPQLYTDGLSWIADRFAGEPAVSSCP